MKLFVLLDNVVLPITTTFSGANSLAISLSLKNNAAWAIAWGKESGSSAITGQSSFLQTPTPDQLGILHDHDQ